MRSSPHGVFLAKVLVTCVGSEFVLPVVLLGVGRVEKFGPYIMENFVCQNAIKSVYSLYDCPYF